jgi:pimeloyl-ACP methyl ester carboxylesterase
VPFIFQHGMGGDANQPLSYIGDAPPSPVISLNARGHSPSTDIDPATASFEVFADDVIALADHLRLARFIIGGISLGAGTALNLSIRYPDRVTTLVLCRPAWLDRPQIPLPRLVEAELHSDAGLPRRGNSTPQSLISRGWPSPAPRCTARNPRRSQSSMRTTPWSRYGHSPGPASS